MILLRESGGAPELLLVRRNPRSRFMGGFWVFPGGSLTSGDGDGQPGLMAAARRELAEEAGIVLADGHPLVAFARWITPEASAMRFDTWFYLAACDGEAVARVDGEEIVDALWITPEAALAQAAGGGLTIGFPTLRQLEELAGRTSAAGLLEEFAAREIEPVRPRIVAGRILLPGDAGY